MYRCQSTTLFHLQDWSPSMVLLSREVNLACIAGSKIMPSPHVRHCPPPFPQLWKPLSFLIVDRWVKTPEWNRSTLYMKTYRLILYKDTTISKQLLLELIFNNMLTFQKNFNILKQLLHCTTLLRTCCAVIWHIYDKLESPSIRAVNLFKNFSSIWVETNGAPGWKQYSSCPLLFLIASSTYISK